jgi:hypothetical protein
MHFLVILSENFVSWCQSLKNSSASRATMATRNDRLQCTWMMSFSSVHICIAFRLLRRGNMKLHALLGHHVSETFVSWCQAFKKGSASFLCIHETYRSSPQSRNLKVIQNVYISFDLKCICVWCLDNWSRILSGKSFNTFSMGRLKTLQFRLTPTLLFTARHGFFFLSFTIFFHDLWLG